MWLIIYWKNKEQFMVLNSLNYVRLISWLAYNKHKTILNKTQMQKLLFICYGLYYSKYDKPLFDDDNPKAWPFGPVFPRSYKRYVEEIPMDLSKDEKSAFLEDRTTLQLITKVVDSYYCYSASTLSEWSHRKDSPWAKTVFSDSDNSIQWNKEIDSSTIKNFFGSEKWKVGL